MVGGAWGVDVRVGAAPGQEDELATVAAQLDALLGDAVYAHELVDLPRVVQNLMVARGLSLAVAESCTGGLLGGAITDQDGSSAYFRGGILSYANEVKRDQLAVDEADLWPTAPCPSRWPARWPGARGSGLRADYALAITGIAGPGGGTDEKPVGTTWIALAGPNDACWAIRYRFTTGRERNRTLAVACALDLLRRALTDKPGGRPGSVHLDPSAMRLFVAVNPGEHLVHQVDTWLDDHRPRFQVAWTRPTTWHLTLMFLGSWPAAREEALVPGLQQALSGLPPFQIQPGALGAFPSLRRPRVLFLQLDGGAALPNLAEAVRGAVEHTWPDGPPGPQGLSSAPNPGPHQRPPAVARGAEPHQPGADGGPFPGSLPVDQALLMASELHRDGARYTVRATLPLQG